MDSDTKEFKEDYVSKLEKSLDDTKNDNINLRDIINKEKVNYNNIINE